MVEKGIQPMQSNSRFLLLLYNVILSHTKFLKLENYGNTYLIVITEFYWYDMLKISVRIWFTAGTQQIFNKSNWTHRHSLSMHSCKWPEFNVDNLIVHGIFTWNILNSLWTSFTTFIEFLLCVRNYTTVKINHFNLSLLII